MSGAAVPWPADWLVPDWPAPPWVRAVCTSRSAGVSAPPWDSMNLGEHVGDAPAAVRANRAALARCLHATPVFLEQVHGSAVLQLPVRTAGQCWQADASVSREPGQVCTVMVADCLPVLLVDPQGIAVAAAHAGWRGLLGQNGQGVLETSVAALGPDAPARALAWLGPCIGPHAFEVGDEVRAAFMAHDAAAQALFRPAAVQGKWWCDLAGLARQRLQALGLRSIYGNDGSSPWCTVGNPSRFFSHRRDTLRCGGSGRFAACIWIE